MYIVYSKPNCPACDEAKLLLELKGQKVNVQTLGKDFDMLHLLEVGESLGVRPGSFPFIVLVTDHNENDRALTLAQLKAEFE